MSAQAKPASWEKIFWPLLAALLLLATWHYAVSWTGTKVFPSPLVVGSGLVELWQQRRALARTSGIRCAAWRSDLRWRRCSGLPSDWRWAGFRGWRDYQSADPDAAADLAAGLDSAGGHLVRRGRYARRSF